jgi:molybdenum cofactor biosynthesis protein B
MGYHDHKHHAPASVSCAVLVISGSRTEHDDESGKLLMKMLEDNGHKVAAFDILKNDAEAIRAKMEQFMTDDGVQAVISSGGTGASHLDITVETVTPLLEKQMHGFGELFRQLTYQQIGTGSILSRAMAGVAHGTVVICLPGSVAAVEMAMQKIILPEIGHLVREAGR